MSKLSIAILAAYLTSATVFAQERIQIDQVPMYGGMDRQSVPELKAGDDALIERTVREFGSREKASMAFVNQGFNYYQRDDLANAIRRFNQAWLINPDNPEVYWGFASVLQDRQDYCEARRMAEIVLSKGKELIQPGFLSDAALVYAGCVAVSKNLAPEARATYLKKSDELFEQALATKVRLDYIYHQWARAMYGQGDYAGAWDKVAKYRAATGKEFDARFLQVLSAKMPEPSK